MRCFPLSLRKGSGNASIAERFNLFGESRVKTTQRGEFVELRQKNRNLALIIQGPEEYGKKELDGIRQGWRSN
jgi:hypothetical protein